MNASTFYPLRTVVFDSLGHNLALIGNVARFAGFTLSFDPIEAGRQIVSEMAYGFVEIRAFSEDKCRAIAREWIEMKRAARDAARNGSPMK